MPPPAPGVLAPLPRPSTASAHCHCPACLLWTVTQTHHHPARGSCRGDSGWPRVTGGSMGEWTLGTEGARLTHLDCPQRSQAPSSKKPTCAAHTRIRWPSAQGRPPRAWPARTHLQSLRTFPSRAGPPGSGAGPGSGREVGLEAEMWGPQKQEAPACLSSCPASKGHLPRGSRRRGWSLGLWHEVPVKPRPISSFQEPQSWAQPTGRYGHWTQSHEVRLQGCRRSRLGASPHGHAGLHG